QATYTNQIRTYMQTAEERFIHAQDWETNAQRLAQLQLSDSQKKELVEKINTSVEALATPSLLYDEVPEEVRHIKAITIRTTDQLRSAENETELSRDFLSFQAEIAGARNKFNARVRELRQHHLEQEKQ